MPTRQSGLARRATAFFIGLLVCGVAAAQSLGTVFSDLWWNPSESGWGVTIAHQQDVMFLTFFVYKDDRSPYWVTATLSRTASGIGPPFVF